MLAQLNCTVTSIYVMLVSARILVDNKLLSLLATPINFRKPSGYDRIYRKRTINTFIWQHNYIAKYAQHACRNCVESTARTENQCNKLIHQTTCMTKTNIHRITNLNKAEVIRPVTEKTQRPMSLILTLNLTNLFFLADNLLGLLDR